ncbi:hypothetical protein B296_00017002 [Ensete ventricosum]|uniref:Uncharacterized protein n=1 Tax=Ensete ventricosum TaxID=4639 RepID=A0A426YRX5_ENSVE|nr:hypothetical protein B296_00017002 [Ensete ventricosum]
MMVNMTSKAIVEIARMVFILISAAHVMLLLRFPNSCIKAKPIGAVPAGTASCNQPTGVVSNRERTRKGCRLQGAHSQPCRQQGRRHCPQGWPPLSRVVVGGQGQSPPTQGNSGNDGSSGADGARGVRASF